MELHRWVQQKNTSTFHKPNLEEFEVTPKYYSAYK